MSPSMRSARLLLLLQLVAFNRQHVSKAFSNQRLASFVLQNQNQIKQQPRENPDPEQQDVQEAEQTDQALQEKRHSVAA